MAAKFAVKLAGCHDLRDLCNLLVESPLYNHKFVACLLAEVREDGHLHEIGRYGISGGTVNAKAVPLWDTGLIAEAVKKQGPTLIRDLQSAAENNLLTPMSDIDEIVLSNPFKEVLMLPLRRGGHLFGVLGMLSLTPIADDLKSNLDFGELQALLYLTTRSLEFGTGSATQPMQQGLNLSSREKLVLASIARDATNKEIALELNLSTATIKLAVASLLAKLMVNSRYSLAEKAKGLGIIS